MFLIKTYIGPSPIHKIGVFAGEFIPKGTKVWVWTAGLDITLSEDVVRNLTEHDRQFFETYAWKQNGQYHLCVDNARFINHSDLPNLSSVTEYDIAKRDIQIGEELTANYWEFHEGDEI